MSSGQPVDDRPSGPKIIIPKAAIREKGTISIRLHTKQIQQPPNTIPLSELIDKACQKIYNSLENSLDLLVKMPNTEKKRSLLMNLNWIKEVLMKIFILSLDIPHSRRLLTTMDLCQEIFSFQSKLFNIPDSLYAIHMGNLKLLQPSYDISAALTLLTNQQLPYPAVIKPNNEVEGLSIKFETFLTKKISIQSVAFEIFKNFNFQFKIEGGILEIYQANSFSISFSYHVIRKRWILLTVNYPFLSSLKNENFSLLLNNQINLFDQVNQADEFIQIYFFLYCVIYFGQLMKLKSFSESLNLSLDTDSITKSLSLKILIWPDFEDCFVSLVLPQFEATFNSHSVFVELCEGIYKFPLITLQSTFQERVYISLDKDLSLLYQCYREKATIQRLSQIQYFLPDFFSVSFDHSFALLSCSCTNFVLLLNDSNGNFILTRQSNSLLEEWEFKNVNELSAGILSIFIQQITGIVLEELCKHSHFAYLNEEEKENTGSFVVDEIFSLKYEIKVGMGGIMIFNQESLLFNFESFEFNFEKYLEVVNSRTEEIFNLTLGKIPLTLSCFSNLSFRVNLLVGKTTFLDIFYSSFVSVMNGIFYIPILSESQLINSLSILTAVDHFISYFQVTFPQISIVCHIFAIGFVIDTFSIRIDFLNREIFINGKIEVVFDTILWSLLEKEKYLEFFDKLKFVFSLRQQLQPTHFKHLQSSFGPFLIGLFDNFSLKISLLSPDIFLFSLHKKDLHLGSLFRSNFLGTPIAISTLSDAFNFYLKLDFLISKFTRLTDELKKIIATDKIKQTFSSFEFTLNSFTCMFYLTDEKIVFNQVFLTDPNGKAFSCWVESEIEKGEDMKALVISFLHLVRTTPSFMADFCRAIRNCDSNPQISCYIPLVLPNYYSTPNTVHRNTITFHNNTKSLTLFLIFKLIRVRQDIPLFINYSLETNTITIPDKYKEALEDYQQLIEDVCKGQERKNMQINHYIELIKQKLIGK